MYRKCAIWFCGKHLSGDQNTTRVYTFPVLQQVVLLHEQYFFLTFQYSLVHALPMKRFVDALLLSLCPPSEAIYDDYTAPRGKDKFIVFGILAVQLNTYIMNPLYIILGVVAVLAFWIISMYNRLITLSQQMKEAWADIDVQLKRRYDLIPNLVETVKGYAAHESQTLAAVTDMRTRAMSATTPAGHAEAENMLSGALKSLFAVSENYPDLKAHLNVHCHCVPHPTNPYGKTYRR